MVETLLYPHGVVNSIQTLLLMPIIGLNQEYNLSSATTSSKKYDRVKSAAKSAIFAATTVVMIGFAITRLFPVQLVPCSTATDCLF